MNPDSLSTFVDNLFVPYAEAMETACKIFLLILPIAIFVALVRWLILLGRYLENDD